MTNLSKKIPVPCLNGDIGTFCATKLLLYKSFFVSPHCMISSDLHFTDKHFIVICFCMKQIYFIFYLWDQGVEFDNKWIMRNSLVETFIICVHVISMLYNTDIKLWIDRSEGIVILLIMIIMNCPKETFK